MAQGKEFICQAGDVGSIPDQEDPVEKQMANHSRDLAWKIPWTEEPGGLQSMGLQRVRHDLVSKQQEQQEHYIANCVSWVPKLALPDL